MKNSNRPASTRATLALAAVATLATATTSAHAAALAWNGSGAASGTATPWSLATNWTPNQVPASGDTLTFPSTTNSRTANNDLAGLTLAAVTISGAAYSITGTSFGVAGEIAYTAGGGNISTLAAPVALGAATAFNVAATTSGRLQVDGDLTGAFDLTKNGAGLMRFSSAKSYTGNTLLNAGTLDFSGGAGVSGAGRGGFFVDAGATLSAANVNFAINGLNGGANGAGTVQKNGNNSRTISVGNGDANGRFAGTFTIGTGATGALTIGKDGGGTQVLSGTVTPNAGGTSVGLNANNGRLLVDGAFGSANLTFVAATGTLGGTGTLNAVTVSGNLRPGGTLANTVTGTPATESTAVLATGALTLNASAVTTLEIAGLAREAQYDGLDVGGALAYGGTLNVTGAIPGLFDLFAFPLPTVPTGTLAAVNVNGNALTGLAGVYTGTDGVNSFTFTQASGDLLVVVPEPTTLAALAGAAMVGLLRRRR